MVVPYLGRRAVVFMYDYGCCRICPGGNKRGPGVKTVNKIGGGPLNLPLPPPPVFDATLPAEHTNQELAPAPAIKRTYPKV
jgi:hypothetical protein